MDPVNGEGGQGQVTDPGAGQVPDQGELGEGREGDGGEEREPQPSHQRMVPLHEHVGQRKQFQNRLRQEQERNAQLENRLTQLERRLSGATEDQVDPQQRRWKDYTGVTKLEQAITQIQESLENMGGKVDPELQARLERAEHAAAMAFDGYVTSIEQTVRSSFDAKSMPGMTAQRWEKLVASEMTARETQAIANGRRDVLQTVIERVKADWGVLPNRQSSPPGGQPRRTNGQFTKPPQTPGSGGNPPAEPPAEKLTGRKLHERAFSTFKAAQGAEG